MSPRDLFVPPPQTTTSLHRAYASVSSVIFNDLPSFYHLTEGIGASARCLKTFLLVPRTGSNAYD